MNYKEYLEKLVHQQDLSFEEMKQAMDAIMEGQWTPTQIGGFLVALRMKKETISEITAAAISMRNHAVELELNTHELLDIVGTGGDQYGSINVSTLSALVCAAAGVKVAKHGNRSVSSHCGSADILEKWGVNLDASPEIVKRSIQETNFGFLFAPKFHPAMKYAIGPRKELGIRTLFNILGPLTNPTAPNYMVLGVYNPSLLDVYASVMQESNYPGRVAIIHGLDGMDELSCSAPSMVVEICRGTVSRYEIDPQQYLGRIAPRQAILGKDPDYNATLGKKILAGIEKGPMRDIVVLNASLGLYITGTASSLQEGIQMAEHILDQGHALAILDKVVSLTRESI